MTPTTKKGYAMTTVPSYVPTAEDTADMATYSIDNDNYHDGEAYVPGTCVACGQDLVGECPARAGLPHYAR